MPGYIGLGLLIATFIVTYQGLRHTLLMERYQFWVDGVRVHRDYKRLFTSIFLHMSWGHFVLNVLGIFFIGGMMEATLGPVAFALLYLASGVGGNALLLWLKRYEPGYTTMGATGAISGVLFAAVALFPQSTMMLVFIPMKAWFFGLAFMILTIWGIRSGRGGVAYEAHLGGALAGMMIGLLLQPQALTANWIYITAVTVPALVFLYIAARKPQLLHVDLFPSSGRQPARVLNLEDRYNSDKKIRQEEIDRILDKIHRKGMGGLTARERQLLKEYSAKG
ncbi:rhomboid family intramembrane serine protease [Flaviaesturariibacter amylovorans]|uniref:Rhomboid family intramembrane serine protease n=1 Tax=Flaviaesturariibacter amylovorans TaxID=1084520 RepID=A0ABP8G979_9BACT